MDSNPKIGIFVGSFDPYTIGHDSIVRRILPLFDRLVIGVGVNMQKNIDTARKNASRPLAICMPMSRASA